ncbi:MAG: hypothetical protein WBO71_07735, partial [Thermoanaerobaculia bacterium]
DDRLEELSAISRLDFPPWYPGTTSVRTRRWKLIEGELRDLLRDPGEEWYASPTTGGIEAAELLDQDLHQALEEREPFPPEVVAPPDSTLDELRALGYIQ